MGNFDRHDGLLLTITVTGSMASTSLQTTLPRRQSFVNDFRTMTQDQVAGRFVVEAGPGTTLNRETFSSRTDYRCVCFLRNQATQTRLQHAMIVMMLWWMKCWVYLIDWFRFIPNTRGNDWKSVNFWRIVLIRLEADRIPSFPVHLLTSSHKNLKLAPSRDNHREMSYPRTQQHDQGKS